MSQRSHNAAGYDFRDLASVETLQPETHIDVKAVARSNHELKSESSKRHLTQSSDFPSVSKVIFHVQEPFTFTAKTSNKEMTKRVSRQVKQILLILSHVYLQSPA